MSAESLATPNTRLPGLELTRPGSPWRDRPNDWFYFGCAWLVLALVGYGFSQTLSQSLLHTAVPRPTILWIHAGVFSAWIGLFLVQSGLIRSRHVRWHRRLGVAGLVLGAIIPPLGIATGLVMGRFDVVQGLRTQVYAAAHLAIPLNDMLFFAGTLFAAAWWRKRPDVHRRLMLIATCLLTSAAFPRFPFIMITALRWYPGVDALLMLAIARDLTVQRRIHRVYLISVPPILVGQAVAMWLFLGKPQWWIEFANHLIG
jgi:hypothetical protein